MSKKYELTNVATRKLFNGKPLYRIKALKDFKTLTGDIVRSGDFGGYVMSEDNLSQYGKSWIFSDSLAYDDSRILDNAVLYNCSQAYNNTKISDNAVLKEGSRAYGNSKIYGDALVKRSSIYGYSEVFGKAFISNSRIGECAEVYGNSAVRSSATIYGHTSIYGNAIVEGDGILTGYLKIFDDAYVSTPALTRFYGNGRICGNAEIIQYDHLMTVGFFGFEKGWKKETITFFRNKENTISVQYCNFLGSLDDFIKIINEKKKKGKIIKQDLKIYKAAIQLAKATISLNREPNDPF